MSTQLGKELKKLRIDLSMTLMDMAKVLNLSAAFLSAIETGRKRVPDNFLEVLSSKFPAVANARNKYEVLINQARKEVVVQFDEANHDDAVLATALARRFNTMSSEEKEVLRNIFSKEK
jgi:transcriptional regulator with XRE-family HTH domain